jgi:uncharacterized protein YbaP (TraB family)
MNKKSSDPKIKHLVANNPEYDRATMDPEEVAAERRARKNTLYDSSYKTAAGHWKRRDEPGEPRKTEYLKIAPDALRKQKQWDARQRLKKKDAVPTRQGKKLFDEFMREANTGRNPTVLNQLKGRSKDLNDLLNLYNASSALDFEQWLAFLKDTLDDGKRI